MTIKDHPRRLFERVSEEWADLSGAMDFNDWVEIPGQPLPDIIPGTNNPDAQTTRWEWTTDLTVEQEAAWDTMIERMLGGGDGSMPTEAAIDGLISTMAAYKASPPGTPTSTQMDSTIRAIIDYIRYIELRID
jgi:hypothetical protein